MNPVKTYDMQTHEVKVEENKILVLILKHFSKLIEPFFSDPVPTFESRHVDNGTIICTLQL
jgi:hypothetical protein